MTIKEFNESLTDEYLLELMATLGVTDYIDKNDYFVFPTCCHHKDPNEGSKKLYYYKKDKRFMCYTDCGCSFNIFTLFEKRYQILDTSYNFYTDVVLKIMKNQAITFAEGFYEKYESDFDKYNYVPPKIEDKIINPNILSMFSNEYPSMWLEEGISKETMDKFNIKYSINRNKIIIPHYNCGGDLIGIRGRALNEEDLAIGKYMPIQIESTIYSHPLMYHLYGLNFNKDNIKKLKMAIIFEGEKSVLLYDSYFPLNIAVATCGCSLHLYQIELLKKFGAQKILLAYDKEGESNKDKEKYINKLHNTCSKYKNICSIGYLYDFNDLLDNKDSPIDKGKNTFLNIYKKGVWLS